MRARDSFDISIYLLMCFSMKIHRVGGFGKTEINWAGVLAEMACSFPEVVLGGPGCESS